MKILFLVSEASSKYQMGIYNDLLHRKDCKIIAPFGAASFAQKIVRRILIIIDRLFKTNFRKNKYKKVLRMVARERSAVVIEPGFIVTCSKHFIYRLRKICPFLALNLVDAMGAHSPSLVSVKEFIMSFKWDCVLTSNINDSMKYGWIYRGITCSRTSGVKPSKKKSDAYLICGLKGNREQLIYDTFRKMNDEGAKCRYEIWCHNKKQFKEVKFKNEIKYSLFFKKYKKVASLVLSTNCIVEIVQEGHNNGTLRWFEAITLNKKLLTNNRGIFNMPFYNPLYMKYFEKAEDIDVEWVKRVEKVEYGYNNDFSSINLLNRIKSEIKNRGLS